MERKFIFKYDALNDYLTENQKNPNRTDGELTLLRDNCRSNLTDVLFSQKEYIIIINETTWEIKINGERNLEDKFYTIPTWYKMTNRDRLYHQVKQAMEEAKNRWIYDQIFKEIKSK